MTGHLPELLATQVSIVLPEDNVKEPPLEPERWTPDGQLISVNFHRPDTGHEPTFDELSDARDVINLLR